MTHSPRALVGALVLTFIACGTFVACGTAVVPEEPELTTGKRLSGLCGDVWSPTGSMAEGRFIATATRLADGTVLVAGGFSDDGTGNVDITTSAERYNPTTDTWSNASTMSYPRYWHRAVRLPSGKVLAVGGVIAPGPTATATAEIYDPATNGWSLAASMSTARWAFQLTTLSDGRVLASGGIGDAVSAMDTAEIYDPQTNRWSPLSPSTGKMTSPRFLAGSALLSDGRVLVAGGNNGTDHLSSAEIFNPSTGTWSAVPPLSTARYALGMATLQDGRVLAVGGTADFPGAEIFNPASGTWSPTVDMAQVPRYFFETIPLADGRVMVAGGVGDSGPYLDGVEVFDAALGGWTQISSMSTSRYLAASAELLDGRVLIAGGYTQTSTGAVLTTNTAET